MHPWGLEVGKLYVDGGDDGSGGGNDGNGCVWCWCYPNAKSHSFVHDLGHAAHCCRSGFIWLGHLKSEQTIDGRSFNFQKQAPTLFDFSMSRSHPPSIWLI